MNTQNEPRTLTPQEALRALADGKRLTKSDWRPEYLEPEDVLNDGWQAACQFKNAQQAAKSAESYVPGIFRCAKCDLRLVSSTIYTQTGQIGPNSEPQECSNGCGPMWRVTWKQEAKEGYETINQLADELQDFRTKSAESVKGFDEWNQGQLKKLQESGANTAAFDWGMCEPKHRAGWQARQPEIDALKAKIESHESQMAGLEDYRCELVGKVDALKVDNAAKDARIADLEGYATRGDLSLWDKGERIKALEGELLLMWKNRVSDSMENQFSEEFSFLASLYPLAKALADRAEQSKQKGGEGNG